MSGEAMAVWILFAVSLLPCYALIRLNLVGPVRRSFIAEQDFPHNYDRLPSFDAMMYHPRHQLRWTRAQWLAWLERQP